MLAVKAFYFYDGDMNDGELHVEKIKATSWRLVQVIAKELETSSGGKLMLVGLRETIAASSWEE